MSSRTPQIKRHKASNQVIVYLDGRYRYYGQWNNANSHAKATQAIADYLARGRRVVEPTKPLAVAELVDLYQAAGQDKDGRDTRAIRHLLDVYGSLPVIQFGPVALKAVRKRMIDADWTRRDIDLCVHRIKRIFRWGVEDEVVPDAIASALGKVRCLDHGIAREGKHVTPVDEITFRKTLPKLSRILRAVAELQWLTGARSGELLAMRPCDVDRSQSPWVYSPVKHKTARRGHQRTIVLGPVAQQILTPFLDRPADRLCFRPCDLRKYWTDQYTPAIYGGAIRKACKAAKVPHWHPHQLRHAAGARVRRDFGADAAQAMLGHRHMAMTERYAGPSLELAKDAARKAG